MAAAVVKVTETQKIEHYKALSFQSNSLPHVIWTGKQRIEVTAIPTKYKYSTPTLINQRQNEHRKTYLYSNSLFIINTHITNYTTPRNY